MKSAWTVMPELWCYLGRGWPRLLEVYWSDYPWDSQSKTIPLWFGLVISMMPVEICHVGNSVILKETVPGTGNKAALGWALDRMRGELFSHWTSWCFDWVLLHGHASTLPVVGVSQCLPHGCRLKTRRHGCALRVPPVGCWSCGLWKKPHLIAVINYFPCQWFKCWCAYISSGELVMNADISEPLAEILIKCEVGPLILFVTNTSDNSNAFSSKFSR